MGQADPAQRIENPGQPGSTGTLALTLVALFGLLGLGMGLTAYGLYRLFGRSTTTPPVTHSPAGRPAPGKPAGRPARSHPAASQAQRAEISRLIAQLGDDQWARRNAAFKRLIEIGPPARAQLEQTLTEKPSEEVRWRVQSILQEIERRRRGQ